MKISEDVRLSSLESFARTIADVFGVVGLAAIPLQFLHNWRVGAAAFWGSGTAPLAGTVATDR